jgi:hypothetical protein
VWRYRLGVLVAAGDPVEAAPVRCPPRGAKRGRREERYSVQIFIDESGIFATSSEGPSFGTLGSLVITESQLAIVDRMYSQLRPLLPKERGEVKGRLLDESDVARVVNLARRAGLIYEATLIGLLPDHASAVEVHRTGQCEGLTRNLTDAHEPAVISDAFELRHRLEQMPLQLYVQSVATFDLLWRTLQHATLYYSQREPRALARFRWVIDAKERNRITDAEDWWSRVVRPVMQSQSLREPFPQLEQGDYSHMIAEEVPMPDHLTEAFPRLNGETALRMNAAFDEIEFSPAPLIGLEIVDVLTNALRRALAGRLDERGWGRIAGVMIHRQPPYVHPVGFGENPCLVEPSVAAVLRRLAAGGRSMLTSAVLEQRS